MSTNRVPPHTSDKRYAEAINYFEMPWDHHESKIWHCSPAEVFQDKAFSGNFHVKRLGRVYVSEDEVPLNP